MFCVVLFGERFRRALLHCISVLSSSVAYVSHVVCAVLFSFHVFFVRSAMFLIHGAICCCFRVSHCMSVMFLSFHGALCAIHAHLGFVGVFTVQFFTFRCRTVILYVLVAFFYITMLFDSIFTFTVLFARLFYFVFLICILFFCPATPFCLHIYFDVVFIPMCFVRIQIFISFPWF